MRVLLVALIACSTPAPPPPAAPAPEPPPRDLHFTLEVGGTVTTPSGSLPLVATKQIHKGDTMFLTIKTSRRARLYIAYCDSEGKLAIYPATGNLVGEADAVTRVPQTESFIADNRVGLEHVFVIATSDDLHRSDPKLHELLSRAQGESATACSTQLAMTTQESRAAVAPVAPPAASTAEKPRFASVPKIWRPRGFGITGGAATTSSTSSDDAGIAIWAISLQHE